MQTQREREGRRKLHRETYKQRTNILRGRERETQIDREKDRDIEKEREIQRERERDIQTETRV